MKEAAICSSYSVGNSKEDFAAWITNRNFFPQVIQSKDRNPERWWISILGYFQGTERGSDLPFSTSGIALL